MACFVVPAVEAVVVTTAYFVAKHKEQKIVSPKLATEGKFDTKEVKITWSKRLSWLLEMLWGGVILLAFEHFWHGEVIPYPPYLSAMLSAEDTKAMLHEMSTVGVSMALFVTSAWGLICTVAQAKVKQIKSKLNKESV